MAPRKRDLELDDALKTVGSFGRFQLLMFALLFPVAIFHGARMTSSSFFMLDQKHRCSLPDWPNDTYGLQKSSMAHQIDYNMTIPPGDSCHIYSLNHTFEYDEFHRPINGSDFLQPCPKRWVYDTSIIHLNAMSKLDLVCDKKIFRSHATMSLYLGSMIGGPILGMISDRFGRKPCLVLSVVLFLVSGLPLPWSPNFATLVALEFIVGAASTGMFASALLMGLELVLAKNRSVAGLVIQMFFTIGEILLSAFFLGLRDWRWVEILITAPAAVFLLYYWLIPESLRWLMLHKRYDKASEVLTKIARFNGVQPPGSEDEQKDLEKLLQSHDHTDHVRNSEKQPKTKKDSFLDLFKSCVLAVRACTVFLNWVVVNMVFFGFVLNTAHLKAGTVFVNFIIGAVVEFPAHLTTLTLVGRVGRKPVHCSLLLLTAVASGAAAGVAIKADEAHHWVVVMLAMIGKFGAAGLMGTSFLWTTELFPTSIRGTGLAVSSSFARAGAMASPYIVQSGTIMTPHNIGTAMPFMVFCGASLLAFLINLQLPETNKKELPETVQDAREFGRAPSTQLTTTSKPTYGSLNASVSYDTECSYQDGAQPDRSVVYKQPVTDGDPVIF